MVIYNNSAGRILRVLAPLCDKGTGVQVKVADLGTCFRVDPDWASLLSAYSDIKDEYSELVKEIESITNIAKRDLYQKNLMDIDASLRSFSFNIRENWGAYTISRTAVVALEFMSADLLQDESAATDDIGAIRQIVTDLQQEIEASTDFSKQMREWLLDLVRIIRDSIDRYTNRGSRGMKKQFSLLLGELMQNWNDAKEVSEKSPTIWTRVTSAIDLMGKIASLTEKCKPAIEFSQKLLPFMKTLGLPSPSDLNP